MNGIEKGRYVIHWSGKRGARRSVGIFMSLCWADWMGRGGARVVFMLTMKCE